MSVDAPIYLTFDDGPRETTTPAILDHLGADDVRATFFQEGRWVIRGPGLTRAIAPQSSRRISWRYPEPKPETSNHEPKRHQPTYACSTGARTSYSSRTN